MPGSRFVKPAGSNRIWAVSIAAALLLCVLTGPFGTIILPWPTRTLVWAALIGINAAKWWLWYRWLGPRMGTSPWHDLAVAGGGALLLTATIPLELRFVYRAVGLDIAADWRILWLTAALIAASISAVIAIAGATLGRPGAPPPASPSTEQPPPATPPPPAGLSLRVDLSALLAVTAEDHYLRLHLDNGHKPLLLYRFGDAVADLAGIDGLQVHRSAWVAARAVASAQRQGRRWWLILPDGTRVAVSDRHLPAVRARGWLAR